jgi:dTDP-4-dehydrorhamnose 3,5-epimerase
MQFIPLELPGLWLIKSPVFSDERGYFFEAYHYRIFKDFGIDTTFVQDNQSLSARNVLRGLHFQNPPYEQGKLVRVVHGQALDVVVDIRKGSPTFGKHVMVILGHPNHDMLWIPPGFAHGFLALENDTIFYYKCTNYYHRNSESGIIWNDPDLKINWTTEHPILSRKDQQLPRLSQIDSPFTFQAG